MSGLDFKEIPEAHKGSGLQDTFELLARDFFEFLNYKILIEPSRGADGGKDLVLEESRIGVGGETKYKWLVSCKHKVFSGTSVNNGDEKDILDRVQTNNCSGFIGFYSTLPSSALVTKLESLKNKIEYQIFDSRKIEKELLSSTKGIELAKRYFPKSINKLIKENPKPSQILTEEVKIKCEKCNKELLSYDTNGIITFWKTYTDESHFEGEKIADIYFACKGYCDRSLEVEYRKKYSFGGWDDISDILIPTFYLKWVMSILGSIKRKDEFSEKAMEKLRQFMFGTFPYISRKLTSKEEDRVQSLMFLPTILGGFGNEV